MCRLFTLRTAKADLVKTFGISLPDFRPSFSIKTTLSCLGIRIGTDGQREGAIFRWGLIPSWAKDMKIGASLVNARSETVSEKPSFRTAYKKRRCLILADGFFEARAISAKTKNYFFIHQKNDQPFAFAGLWESWKPGDGGDPVESCTVITTEPNKLMAKIHDRMPVIVQPNEYDVWLDQEVQPGPLLDSIIATRDYPDQIATQVSNRAWTRSGNDPESIQPVS